MKHKYDLMDKVVIEVTAQVSGMTLKGERICQVVAMFASDNGEGITVFEYQVASDSYGKKHPTTVKENEILRKL